MIPTDAYNSMMHLVYINCLQPKKMLYNFLQNKSRTVHELLSEMIKSVFRGCFCYWYAI